MAPPLGIELRRDRRSGRRRRRRSGSARAPPGRGASLHHQRSDDEFADLAAGADRRALVEILADVLAARSAPRPAPARRCAGRRVRRWRCRRPASRDAATVLASKTIEASRRIQVSFGEPRLVTIGGISNSPERGRDDAAGRRLRLGRRLRRRRGGGTANSAPIARRHRGHHQRGEDRLQQRRRAGCGGGGGGGASPGVRSGSSGSSIGHGDALQIGLDEVLDLLTPARLLHLAQAAAAAVGDARFGDAVVGDGVGARDVGRAARCRRR